MTTLQGFRDWFVDRRSGASRGHADNAFVAGLGRFGVSLATTLVDLGVEVMAVDTDESRVNEWVGKLTHVRVADTTSAAALRQLNVNEFDAVVVAIGSNIEASILTVSALDELGVENIWAQAATEEHRRILERVGADHVVFPEQQMGERVAHIVTGDVIDYFELDEGFVLAEIDTPRFLAGTPLGASEVRRKYDITVVCLKPRGGSFTYATADTVPEQGDIMVIAGTVEAADRLIAASMKDR